MDFLALVIEPDGGLRHLVREALRGDGWRVVEACTADEVMSAISLRRQWPLVFCSDGFPSSESQAPGGTSILDALRSHLGALLTS